MRSRDVRATTAGLLFIAATATSLRPAHGRPLRTRVGRLRVHKSAALPVREIGGVAAPVVRLGQCRKANRADLLLAVEHRVAVRCIPTITRPSRPRITRRTNPRPASAWRAPRRRGHSVLPTYHRRTSASDCESGACERASPGVTLGHAPEVRPRTKGRKAMKDSSLSRWMGPVGLLAVVALFVGFGPLGGGSPGENASGVSVAHWYNTHTGQAWGSIYLVALGLALMLVFVTQLRSVLRDTSGERLWPNVVFAAGIILVGGVVVAGSFQTVLILGVAQPRVRDRQSRKLRRRQQRDPLHLRYGNAHLDDRAGRAPQSLDDAVAEDARVVLGAGRCRLGRWADQLLCHTLRAAHLAHRHRLRHWDEGTSRHARSISEPVRGPGALVDLPVRWEPVTT